MNAYAWSDLRVGMACSFDAVVTESMMRRFLEDTGDDNPLHVDGEFARRHGFEGPVAYGMLAASFYSTLVGVHLPGRNALLHGINVDFQKPVYPGVPLRIRGEIVQLVEAYRRVEIQASITTAEDVVLSKAKIRVGLHG
jgi:3-hydroxybutyryl-CoA dehydratase